VYSFINPYNFIPLGENSPSKTGKEEVYRGSVQKELLSGCLEVSLFIKTPVIIPDGAHPKTRGNGHKEYLFLKQYNPDTEQTEYCIPGSELRGMIRSTYEAVTNSCFPFLPDDKPMSQRVPLYGALKKRGLLGYDGKKWVLYKTEKTLEEVLVIPIFEIGGTYYAESFQKIRDNTENNKKDDNGNFRYPIMKKLNSIEKSLNSLTFENGKELVLNAEIKKSREDRKKWDVFLSGEKRETCKDKNVYRYLFVKDDGSVVDQATGTYVEGKGWLQYNVPVDTSRVYHIAYLKKTEEEYTWDESTARGNENKAVKNNFLYAEAYKKLKSAIVRDGTESYPGGHRANKQTNKDCNFALEKALERACDNPEKMVPVYYFVVRNEEDNNQIVYMSGSAAGRIAQRRTWAEIMEGHTPCKDKLCPACLLFGTLADGGMKGHVRFTDAFMTSNNIPVPKEHHLRILSSPRTTAFEFYLKKPVEGATFWNYDFYGVTEVNEDSDSSRTNYYHLEKALLRGRKMYWHQKKVSPDDQKESKQNSTMFSLDEGTFKFHVYFDQISGEQLTDLVWAINLGENEEDSKLLHKIGHAKPLGYGSVKLIVTGGMVREFGSTGRESEDCYYIKSKSLTEANINVDNPEPSFDKESRVVKSLLRMCNSETCGTENIDYPRTSNGGFIYEWFSENRTNAKTLKVLPEPLEDVLTLTGESREGNRNQNKRNGSKEGIITRKGNRFGSVEIDGKEYTFYADKCPEYGRLKPGDRVVTVIKKNKNNEYYTAYEVKKID